MKCIYNGTIITMNLKNQIIENGIVVIDNNKIIDVGDEKLINKYDFDEKIDAKEGIIMPGFVNGHTHIPMSLFRSLGEDIEDRLRRFMFPIEDELVDKEFVYVGSKFSIIELILGGVTTFADMYYFEDEVAKASKEMGIRCIAGQTILEKTSPDSTKPYGGIDLALNLIEKWKNDDLITPAFAPHSTYSLNKENLIKIKKLSDELNVPILIHIAETNFEIEKFLKEYNKSPIKYLADLNFLGANVVGAHCIFINDDDINLMKKYDIGVINNPSGNAKSGRPISPVLKMIEKNIKVGLGTDGPMSGNHQDILNILGYFCKMQKLNEKNPIVASALSAVKAGTIEGAKAIGLDKKIGSIEKGKLADIIIIDTNAPNVLPIYNYYSAITYAANVSNIVMTMVNGKVLMKDRKILTGNYNKIISDFKDITVKIKDKAKKIEESL